MNETEEHLYMTRQEACDMLRVSMTTFDVYRHRGWVKNYYPNGEPVNKTGRHTVRFLRSEVEAMMRRRDEE